MFNTEYASYEPTVPATIKAAYEFGKGQGLLLDGFMNDENEVVELPTIEITDLTGMVYLRLEIEPSSNILKVTNDLQTVS